MLSLTWRSFLVYTDSWGMLFVALVIFIYTSNLNWKYKMLGLLMAGAIGTFIKTTVFICILAIGIHAVLRCLIHKEENSQLAIRKIITFVIAFSMCFCGMALIQNIARDHYGLQMSKNATTWQYFFMLGQNTDTYGCYNGDDLNVWASFDAMYQTNEEMAKAAFLEAWTRIEKRGVIGNAAYYMRKLTVAYNDGYFHNVAANGEDTSRWGMLYYSNGKYYGALASLFQFLWNGILLLLFLNALLHKRSPKFMLYEILVLGITLYLMCFENRSKYLFMFLPIYLSAAGVALYQISAHFNRINAVLSTIRESAEDRYRIKVNCKEIGND